MREAISLLLLGSHKWMDTAGRVVDRSVPEVIFQLRYPVLC